MLEKILKIVEDEISTFNQDTAYYAQPAQGLLQAYAQLKLAEEIHQLRLLLEREVPLIRGTISRIR